MVSNSQGNYFFYVADGRYDIQISGTGITTYTISNIEVADVTDTAEYLPENYGAVANGVTNDRAAIQAAIDAADAAGGGIVRFGGKNYAIASSLILPRTGGENPANPANGVILLGSGYYATTLTGLASFPTNRAMIEWESLAGVVTWYQRIAYMRIVQPSVSGTMAINFKPTTKASAALIRAEGLNIDLEDLVIEGSNEFHTRNIYLEGNIRSPFIRNIYCDNSQTNYAADCTALETDTTEFSFGGEDSSGFTFGTVINLVAGPRKAGKGPIFKGRAIESTFKGLYSYAGSRNAVGLQFTNSYGCTIENTTNEGRGCQPQVKFDTCRGMQVSMIKVGTPVDEGSGVGNGIELVACTDCTFNVIERNVGQPTFSSFSKDMITCDANTKRCNFTAVEANASFATEIADSGVRNYFEGYNIDTGAFDSAGSFDQGSQNSPYDIKKGSGDTVAALITGKKSRGTIESPTVVTSADNQLDIESYGYDGTNYTLATRIRNRSTGTIAAGQVPGLISFWTANSSGTITQAWQINSSQVLLPVTTGQDIGTTAARPDLVVQDIDSSTLVKIGATPATNTTGLNLTNNAGVFQRNAANNNNITIGNADASDIVQIGSNAASIKLNVDTACKRLKASVETSLVNGDFALHANWGTTATVAVDSSSRDSAFRITVSSSGTGQGASPTVILTFKDGTWTTAPICIINQVGGTGARADVDVTQDATTATLTWVATPVAGLTYIFHGLVMGR